MIFGFGGEVVEGNRGGRGKYGIIINSTAIIRGQHSINLRTNANFVVFSIIIFTMYSPFDI